MTLEALDNALKEIIEHNAKAYLEEPVLYKYLKSDHEEHIAAHEEFQKAMALPAPKTCPKCNDILISIPEKDQFKCDHCTIVFTGETLYQIKSAQGNPLAHNSEPSTEERLLTLFEKVVHFREATVNPDIVTTDEELEKLLQEMFEASYAIPMHKKLEQQYDKDTGDTGYITGEGIPDPTGEWDSYQQFADQVYVAYIQHLLTLKQAVVLLNAFGGGAEPFPDEPPDHDADEITLDFLKTELAKVIGVHSLSLGQVHDAIILNFEEAEEAEANKYDWINPFDGMG